MERVLTDLVGVKVSRVIMKRVANELHGQPVAMTSAPVARVIPNEHLVS